MKRTRTYNVTFTAEVDDATAHVTQYDIEARSRKQAIRRARRVTSLPADELNRAEITTWITNSPETVKTSTNKETTP